MNVLITCWGKTCSTQHAPVNFLLWERDAVIPQQPNYVFPMARGSSLIGILCQVMETGQQKTKYKVINLICILFLSYSCTLKKKKKNFVRMPTTMCLFINKNSLIEMVSNIVRARLVWLASTLYVFGGFSRVLSLHSVWTCISELLISVCGKITTLTSFKLHLIIFTY